MKNCIKSRYKGHLLFRMCLLLIACQQLYLRCPKQSKLTNTEIGRGLATLASFFTLFEDALYFEGCHSRRRPLMVVSSNNLIDVISKIHANGHEDGSVPFDSMKTCYVVCNVFWDFPCTLINTVVGMCRLCHPSPVVDVSVLDSSTTGHQDDSPKGSSVLLEARESIQNMSPENDSSESVLAMDTFSMRDDNKPVRETPSICDNFKTVDVEVESVRSASSTDAAS